MLVFGCGEKLSGLSERVDRVDRLDTKEISENFYPFRSKQRDNAFYLSITEHYTPHSKT